MNGTNGNAFDELRQETTVTRALVLGGGGLAGIAWEVGLLIGLVEAGINVRAADYFLGTSAGSAVVAQITSDLSMDELLRRQVDPDLQAKELPARADFQRMIADFSDCHQKGGSSEEILQRIGSLALSAPTVAEAMRKDVIVSRLPTNIWPKRRMGVVAVDAFSGQRVVFNRDSGVDIVDAVAASCAIPCVWPPVTIAGHRFMDGGSYSMANTDLAAGFKRVLVCQPDVPPFPVVKSLSEEIEQLRLNGAQVEVISPNDAMKMALAAIGGNALDPSLIAVAAKIGREQAGREAVRITGLWR
jgi:NTE family protein